MSKEKWGWMIDDAVRKYKPEYKAKIKDLFYFKNIDRIVTCRLEHFFNLFLKCKENISIKKAIKIEKK